MSMFISLTPPSLSKLYMPTFRCCWKWKLGPSSSRIVTYLHSSARVIGLDPSKFQARPDTRSDYPAMHFLIPRATLWGTPKISITHHQHNAQIHNIASHPARNYGLRRLYSIRGNYFKMRFVSKKQTTQAIDAETGVALLPVEPEDMWHANNLISIDDVVKAHAVRKVVYETETGSTNSEKVHTDLTVKVISTFFDPAASALHVSGRVIKENAFVNVGQHHTLDIELNRPFTIWKNHGWDSVALQTLHEAVNEDKPDALIAVVMQEGLANVCQITDFQTIIKQRIECSVPKKRSSAKETAGGMANFYDKTLATILRDFDFSNPRPLLLASPGFVAQDFRTYMQTEGAKRSDKRLQRMARDAVVVHSSTGYVHSLNEILKSPEVQATMRDKRFFSETNLMDQFYERLRKDDGRAWYGVKPVEKAIAEGAVGRGGGVLMINNSLFRSMDIQTRKRFVGLVDKVKEDGGEAKVLSSDHESGQRLDALGGIAAILTYPIHDLDEDEDEEGNDKGDGQGGEAQETII